MNERDEVLAARARAEEARRQASELLRDPDEHLRLRRSMAELARERDALDAALARERRFKSRGLLLAVTSAAVAALVVFAFILLRLHLG